MNKQIAVLGAGPMGLAVAYELVLHGYQPTVFEAAQKSGGMAVSFDFHGIEIERYYHFHCLNDVGLFELLDELGLSDNLVWVETKMGYWLEGNLQPWGTPMALLKFKGLSLMAKVRYGLHAYISIRRTKWDKLDRLDAASWIRRWVGDEAFDVLWNDLFVYKFHHMADQVSAAWIWSRIRRLGKSRSSIATEKLG